MKVLKSKKAIILLPIFSILILIAGCRAEPIIPKEDIISIQADLGYVIAPTWLLEGFEPMDEYESLNRNVDRYIQIGYLGTHTYDYYSSQVIIFLQYPADTPMALGGTNFLFEALNLDWQAPEDAIETVKVDRREAYFIRGTWSAEVLKAFNQLDEEKLHNMTPEWDYDYQKSVYFEFELSNEEVVNVSLTAMHEAEEISREELIKIAESCVEVE
jgi:hypothetical protein